MSVRPIIDAGPGLNFLSANKERLLIAVLAWVGATSAWIHQVLQRREDGQPDIFRVLT